MTGTAISERYRWLVLSNTTAAVFMSALDGSIVLIALPAIFRGIHLDPLAPANIGFLLWMIMGYRLVQAVLVVNLGRLGDMFGRVRVYNAGFAVFTIASILLSFDPFDQRAGAVWLIGWRVLQAIGGSMLTANSAAILTDTFPANRRGFALGTNQVAAIAGQFIGLTAGGLLAALDWRAVFWVNVPVGVFATIWAYAMLRDTGERHRERMDWWGNATFALGLGAVLFGITNALRPYGGHAMGWTDPLTWTPLGGGVLSLIAFCFVEAHAQAPLFDLALFRIRAFNAGNAAGLLASIGRGGLQFMLVIWLQGIWLPLHGYSFERTPLWAGIYMLPLSLGFLVAGPLSGTLSDKYGARAFATGGMALVSVGFAGMLLLPTDFAFPYFAALILLIGVGTGMFSSPNSSSIMSSVPAHRRGVASGMRATFQNAGTSISIGAFFSLMVVGLSRHLPATLQRGLEQQGVPSGIAHHVASLPPVSSLFAAFLGVNPVQHLLEPTGALRQLTAQQRDRLTGTTFFPHLISQPFHDGLTIVVSAAVVLSVIAALASAMRGAHGPVELPKPTPEPDDMEVLA